VRAFKGIFCADISEFEFYMASQAVRSLCLTRLRSEHADGEHVGDDSRYSLEKKAASRTLSAATSLLQRQLSLRKRPF
jgi:hypothetical protein